MTNIDLKFNGYANFKQVAGQLATLEAQFASLNAQMEKASFGKGGAVFADAQKNARAMQQMYGNSLAASRQFDVTQQKINSHTQEYVKNLQRHKLGLRSLAQEYRSLASGQNAAYREQLRLRKMSVTSFTTDKMGNPLATIAVPRDVPGDLDTIRNRLGMIAHATNSASTQMINWGKNTQWAGRQLSVGFTMPLVAFGALSAKVAYDVDKNLTRIAKVYDTSQDLMASASQQAAQKEHELNQLRADGLATAKTLAMQWGAAGKDTLDVQAQLAATGQKGRALQSATAETQRLAILGEFDYQKAVRATIALQSIYQMSTQQVTDSINYMNAVENATSLSMEDFADAIPIASGPLNNLGADLKDVGFLLTAMKERGVNAVEGADALKSGLIRLYRPSKEVQAEFEQLTGKTLPELTKQSKGELIPLLYEIARAVDGLEPAEKTRALGGLFGAYQVSRLSALLDGMKKGEQGIGQAARALEIANNSAATNTEIARMEMEKLANSASGKFSRALETLKMQLVDTGTEFLAMGAAVLGGASKLLAFFNGLPDGVKTMLKLGIAVAGIAGPLLMLVGLFGNLIGQGVKVGSVVLLAATRFKLLSTNQVAAARVAEFAAKGLGEETRATMAMERQLKSVSIALREATMMQAQYGKASQLAAQQASGAVRTGTTGKPLLSLAQTQQFYGLKGQPVNVPTDVAAQAKADAEKAKHTQQIARFSSIAAISTASMAASMVLGASSSSEWAQHLSTGLMTFAILVPLLQYAPGLFNKMSISSGAIATKWKAAGGGIKGAVGFLRMGLTTVSGIGIAVAAVAAGLFMWYKHLKNSRDEMNNIHSDAEGLGKVFGFEPRKNIVRDDKGAVHKADMALVNRLNEEYPKLASYIRSARGEQAEFNRAAAQGFKAYNAGASAEKAKEVVRTALMAAHYEAKQADAIILKFGFNPADIRQQMQNIQNILKEAPQSKGFFAERNPFGDFGGGIGKQAGKEAGILVQSLVQEGDVAKANKVFKQIVDDFNTEVNKIDSAQTRETMRREWIKSLQQSMGADKEEIERLLNELTYKTQDPGKMGKNFLDDKGRIISAQQLLNTHTAIGAALRRQAAEAQRAKLIDQARLNASAQGNGRLSEALSLLQKGKQMTGLQLQELNKFIGPENKRNATQKAIAALMRQQGIELGGLVAGENATASAANKRKAIEQDILNILGAQKGQTLRQAAMSKAFQIAQTSMTDAWSTVGQMMSSDIDRHFQAQLDGMQAAHQAASAAMQARQQRASNALQARQQRQTNALQRAQDKATQALDEKWRKRKKALQDEEDLRQRMFENEMNRVERMKEAKNMNVDYRVAVASGNLDEAAKIRNEGVANSERWALEDADAKAKAAFDKEMERLDLLEQKEKASLQRRQQAQQQALQARQQAEQQALQASQARQQAALQRQQAAAMASAQRQVEINKAKIQRMLEADLAYIPRTEKEARAYINRLVLKYQKMGIDLSAMSKLYGKSLHEALTSNIIKNANDIKSKIKWAELARTAATQYVKAIWGKSLKDFLKWIETPTKTPKGAPMPSNKKVDVGKSRNSIGGGDGIDAWHRGGMIGGRGSGRAGFPADAAPYANEKLIIAKAGEFLMSHKAVQRLGPDMLNALNKGYPIGRSDIQTGNVSRRKPRTGGASMNIGVESNTIGQMLNRGMKEVIKIKGQEAQVRDMQAIAGGILGGKDLIVGGGGWMRPWRRKYGLTQGLHGAGGLDYGVPAGTPLYSPAAGRVTASYDIGPQRGRRNSGGYGSYGRLVRTQHGNKGVLLAHMSSRGVRAGQGLRKGSYLGRSGNTGNSYGAHVHIETRSGGRVVDPRRLFAANGVNLRTGGELKYDNTIVNAHKGETMLSSAMTQKLKEGVEIAKSDVRRYYRDIVVNVDGKLDMSPRELALEIKKELEYEESRF